MIDFNRVIRAAIKSESILFGSKKALKAAKNRKAVTFIIASNCHLKISNKIKYYASISNIPIQIYPKSKKELGLVCGKPFDVSTVTIRNLEEPELLKMVKGEEVSKAKVAS